jgi:hypothetical protein
MRHRRKEQWLRSFFHDSSLLEAEGNSLFSNYYGIWNGKLSKKMRKDGPAKKALPEAEGSARVRPCPRFSFPLNLSTHQRLNSLVAP